MTNRLDSRGLGSKILVRMPNDPNISRNSNDADVQRAVRSFIYPSDEATLRRVVESWSVADFLYAMERIETDVHQPDLRLGSRQLFRMLLEERKATDSRIASEATNERRHQELMQHMKQQRGNDTTTLGLLRLVASADSGYSATLSEQELAGFKRLEKRGYLSGQIGPVSHDEPETIVECNR